MAELITLTEDGPLGKAGTQVWVNDPVDKPEPKPVPPKAAKHPPVKRAVKKAAAHRK